MKKMNTSNYENVLEEERILMLIDFEMGEFIYASLEFLYYEERWSCIYKVIDAAILS